MRHATATLLAAFAALTGCAEADLADGPAAFAADEVAPMPQPFTLDITDPLVPGDAVTITIGGLLPGETPVVARSNGTLATGPCPAALGGSCLDITPGTSGYSLMNFFPAADAAGESTWTGTLPSTVPAGLTFAFQAVVTSAGAPAVGSNPVARTTGSGGPCPAGEEPDCNGACFPSLWIGDGFCDDGTNATFGFPDFLTCGSFPAEASDCP